MSLLTAVLTKVQTRYGYWVPLFAGANGLDPNLVFALIAKETKGESFKVRYEPGYRYLVNPRDWADHLDVSMSTEVALQSMSWGPAQIMGATARELGFDRDLPQLVDPALALDLSCRKLKLLSQSYRTETDVISSWNQGSPRKTPGGLYQNQRYVDEVAAYLNELRALK